MADWYELRADAADGGLIFWPLVVTEDRDEPYELGAVVKDSAGAAYDWTACTGPVARIYDPTNDSATLASMTWVPRADGTFAFTVSRTDVAALAGPRAQHPNGRRLMWAAKVVTPGGFHMQLVEESPVTVQHGGVV